ncbi:hypothetical protein G6F58_013484 [Rhizopus delemar]|nr:hypothetical protein G6F58_013484 [Rhizopus delemar]
MIESHPSCAADQAVLASGGKGIELLKDNEIIVGQNVSLHIAQPFLLVIRPVVANQRRSHHQVQRQHPYAALGYLVGHGRLRKRARSEKDGTEEEETEEDQGE